MEKIINAVSVLKSKVLKTPPKPKKRLRKYNNLIQAANLGRFLRKMFGMSVMILEDSPTRGIVSNFNMFGFICFLFWSIMYIKWSYISYVEDQTILRNLYNTKLQHYGDMFERAMSIHFVVYNMWKIPFDLSGNGEYLKDISVADKVLVKAGEIINYRKNAYVVLYLSALQVILYCIRLLTVYLSFRHLDSKMPMEKILQVIYTDALAMQITSHYCYYLLILKQRYQAVKTVLNRINHRKAWEYTMYCRGKQPLNMEKITRLQDKSICEKVKLCAKTYGILYKASESFNKQFGMALVLTMFTCMNIIILYSFYFMEATASGLFHDMQRFIDFLIYVSWQVFYSFGVIYLNIYFCETTVCEAKHTSDIVHEIINGDFDPAIIQQATHLSLQLLHQTPEFTACGLYPVNYVLLQDIARSVITFLVVLLQFVTDT